MCGAGVNFCPENTSTSPENPSSSPPSPGAVTTGSTSQPLSPAVAGVVGAIAVIVLVLIGMGVAWAVFRVRFSRSQEQEQTTGKDIHDEERLSSDSVPHAAALKV